VDHWDSVGNKVKDRSEESVPPLNNVQHSWQLLQKSVSICSK